MTGAVAFSIPVCSCSFSTPSISGKAGSHINQSSAVAYRKSLTPGKKRARVSKNIGLPFYHHQQQPLAVLGSTERTPSVSARDKALSDKKLKPLRDPPLRFYDFDPSDIDGVRIRHVLVDTEELADIVFDLVRRKKSTLKELALTLSTCAASKNQGGDLGWWYTHDRIPEDINQFGINEKLFATALRTGGNKLAKVHTRAGFHVFIVEDVRHKINPFRSVVPDRDKMVKPNMRKKMQQGKFKKPVPMSYTIQTLGCQMNKSDTERMAGELERLGYHSVEDPFAASVFILNTCSIRGHAEDKVYSYLGRHVERKILAPEDVTLCVAGCVAQQEGEKLLRRVPALDLVIGPHYSNRLGDLLEDVRINQCQVAATEPIFIQEDISKPVRSSSVTAWVNVIYGCCERCTYCVVPNVRGLEQSRPLEAIYAEIEEIAKGPVREVVLLGQNIDAYGRDMYPKRTFSDLLKLIHDIEGIDRIRFTTSHPRYISDQLIETCANLTKVMPSFHIPPQSGDNNVLREMKRGYTVERFEKIVDRIREKIPDAGIAGDVIVGFPGETEAQFQNTLQMMERVKFDLLNTAAYSPRPNTDAAEFENQVPDAVKTDRLARINTLVTEHARIRSARFLGRLEEILVEKEDPKQAGYVFGRNATGRVTRFPGDINSLLGKIVPIRITDISPFCISGVQEGDAW